jgi:hypothetical protein
MNSTDRSILDDTNTFTSGSEFRFLAPSYKKQNEDKEIKIVPVYTNKYLISSNDNIIFPKKQLVKFKVPEKSTIEKEKKILVNENETTDGSINGIDFDLSGVYTPSWDSSVSINDGSTGPVGDALNIFLSYNRILTIYNSSSSRIEFLKNVLDIINNNSYGLMNLIVAPAYQSGPATIICRRFSNSTDDVKTNSVYRFKPTTVNSAVKEFSYNFQLDNAVMGHTIFNSTAKLRTAFEKQAVTPANKDLIKIKELPQPAELYSNFDYSSFINVDKFYSINNADKILQEKLWKKYQENAERSVTPAGTTEQIKSTADTVKDPPTDWESVLKSKYTSFEKKNTNTTKVTLHGLIYKDTPFIQNLIGNDKSTKKNAILTHIGVSITIDGFSGLRAGECFYVDGIPEAYNKNGIFQIITIKHNITNEDGWKTTIEASWLVNPK